MDTAQASGHTLASDETDKDTGKEADGAWAGRTARVDVSRESKRGMVERRSVAYE